MTWKIAVVALVGVTACGMTGLGGGKSRADDACNARAYSHLLGQPQATVQTISFDQPARITQLGDMATTDHNANRITFTIDKLDNVVSIKCG